MTVSLYEFKNSENKILNIVPLKESPIFPGIHQDCGSAYNITANISGLIQLAVFYATKHRMGLKISKKRFTWLHNSMSVTMSGAIYFHREKFQGGENKKIRNLTNAQGLATHAATIPLQAYKRVFREEFHEFLKAFNDYPGFNGCEIINYLSSKNQNVFCQFHISERLPMDMIDFLMQNKHTKISYFARLDAMLQVVQHVDYFHSKGWMCGDIKPDNILLKKLSEHKFLLKFCDCDYSFRLSSWKKNPQKFIRVPCSEFPQRLYGSYQYLAPECFDNAGIEAMKEHPELLFAVDNFALGSLLFQWYFDVPPYWNTNNEESNKGISGSKNVYTLLKNDKFIPEEKHPIGLLIYKMLNPDDPTQRPTAKDAVAVISKCLLDLNSTPELLQTPLTSMPPRLIEDMIFFSR